MGGPTLANTYCSTPYKSAGAPRQKIVVQMKKQIKTPKLKLGQEGIANLSDAQLKTLVIRILTEMVEYGCKLEEKVKGYAK